MARTTANSSGIRSKIKHPIIDSDGHILEMTPVVQDYMKHIGGRDLFRKTWDRIDWSHRTSLVERRDNWVTMRSWWGSPTNVQDRAAAHLPRVLYNRMDDIGLDFAILYPSFGLALPRIDDPDTRVATCRAFNTYLADTYGPYADRMTPAAVIPMHTPQEAIDELEHAVGVLGLKVIMISLVSRPIPRIARDHPELVGLIDRLETFGLDSEYDYDPVWAKCVELKVAVTSHSFGMGWGSRRSISNYMYNHIGMFGAAGDALCKALFMGGVTRRFPRLNFAFLEGGVGWACNLYADISGHWEKRNVKAIQRLNPANLDRDLLLKLFASHGDELVTAKLEELRQLFHQEEPRPSNLDDLGACHLEEAEQIHDLFVPRFYFGCEADDPMNAWAFNTTVNPFGARLRAVLGSDIGHWDATDMNTVVAEAYEAVEKGRITSDDFRDFVFANPVRLHAGMNPDFFKGTRIEGSVAQLLKTTPI
ncbi:MAG: amidohydrolase family protein [Chloroflexi bacterium]|nr:amidohydrolase family protein [Chloroflexota bacterium]